LVATQQIRAYETGGEHTEKIQAANTIIFFSPSHNAIAEGITSMIQSAKRRARGFRTIEGYAAAIFLAVGKLKLSCPALFP